MTMLLQRSVFVHIPRTGGTWLRNLCRHLRIATLESRDDFYNHCRVADLPPAIRSLPSFSIVRHPLTWIRSRWQFSLKINAWNEKRLHGIHREFDRLTRPSLSETVQQILTHRPGLVGETFREVTAGATYIIRTCDLPLAAVAVLEQVEGVTKETITQALCACPPVNKSEPCLAVLDRRLKSDFLASETEALRLWKNTCYKEQR